MNHPLAPDALAPPGRPEVPGGNVVEAVLREAARLLEALAAEHDAVGAIDLNALSLGNGELAQLRERLGAGEVTVSLGVGAGASLIRETGYAGVWWMSLGGAAAVPPLEQIVVARVPPLVPAHAVDVADAAQRFASDLSIHAAAASARAAPGASEDAGGKAAAGPAVPDPGAVDRPRAAATSKESCR